jgi:hypothetical protein
LWCVFVCFFVFYGLFLIGACRPDPFRECPARAGRPSPGATASPSPPRATMPTPRDRSPRRPCHPPTLAVGVVRIPANITVPRTRRDVPVTSPVI